uniref:Malate dehydrogenase n=1 Tax=Steinernema glaseri TaxID=37863 RepID=A0A1I7Z3W5_9BILA
MRRSSGAVELAARNDQPVPDSWGVRPCGEVSNDPMQILHGGGLLPLGGTEVAGGYKGFGLAALVEVFCGILGGAHWGPHVRKWMTTSADADLGQCFIAIDPDAFAPGFGERMQEFMDTMRNLPPTEGEKDVQVAGDPERTHIELVERLGGIPYHRNQISFAKEFAEVMCVEPMKVLRTVRI